MISISTKVPQLIDHIERDCGVAELEIFPPLVHFGRFAKSQPVKRLLKDFTGFYGKVEFLAGFEAILAEFCTLVGNHCMIISIAYPERFVSFSKIPVRSIVVNIVLVLPAPGYCISLE